MRKSTLIGFPLAVLATAVLFGGIYLVVTVLVPALMRGEWGLPLRIGGIVVIAAVLGYRLYRRIRDRRFR